MNKPLQFTLIILSLLFNAIQLFGQEIPKEYAKKYDGKMVNEYMLLKSKKSSTESIILNKAGEKLAEFDEKKQLIFISNDGKAYYSSNIKGFNDGGGFISTFFQDVEILNLNDQTVEKSEYLIPVLPYENTNLVLVTKDKLFGAIDKNGKIVIPTKYKSIDFLRDEERYLIFTNTEYFITDKNGVSLLEKNFVYNEKTNNKHPSSFISDNIIEASFDGIHIGYYDYVNKKTVVPYEYDEVRKVKNNYYAVKKNKSYALFDADKQTILLPFDVGATFINETFKNRDTEQLFIVYQTVIDGIEKVNIYTQGQVLFDKKYAAKTVDYNPQLPFITGATNEDTHYVFDSNTKNMIMYGLPHIENSCRASYLDDKPEFVVITATIDPKVTNGMNMDWSMLASQEGKVIAGFQPKQNQKFKRFDIGERPIVLTTNKSQEIGNNINLLFSYDDVILKNMVITSISKIKIVDQKLYLPLSPTVPFTIPNKGTFTGGIITVDAKGNLDHIIQE